MQLILIYLCLIFLITGTFSISTGKKEGLSDILDTTNTAVSTANELHELMSRRTNQTKLPKSSKKPRSTTDPTDTRTFWEHFVIDRNGNPFTTKKIGGHGDYYTGKTIKHTIDTLIMDDFIYLKHSGDELIHQINEDELNFGDVITCVMKDFPFKGNNLVDFEHYSVVYNRTIPPIIYEVSKTSMSITNVSDINKNYSGRCLLMKNKFSNYYSEHLNDPSKNITCLNNLYFDWWKRFMNRINDTKNFGKTVTYNVLSCNCQHIAQYIAYGFIQPGCYSINDPNNDYNHILKFKENNSNDILAEYNSFTSSCNIS